jgi:hypothetical protein
MGGIFLSRTLKRRKNPLSKDSANAWFVRGKSAWNVQPTLDPFGYRVAWLGGLSLFVLGDSHVSHSFRSLAESLGFKPSPLPAM